jgi:hypothetical protein
VVLYDLSDMKWCGNLMNFGEGSVWRVRAVELPDGQDVARVLWPACWMSLRTAGNHDMGGGLCVRRVLHPEREVIERGGCYGQLLGLLMLERFA